MWDTVRGGRPEIPWDNMSYSTMKKIVRPGKKRIVPTDLQKGKRTIRSPAENNHGPKGKGKGTGSEETIFV